MAKKNKIVEAKITLDSKDYEKNLSNVSKKTENENKKIKKSNDNLAKDKEKNNQKIIKSNDNLAKNYTGLRTSSVSNMDKIKNASGKMKAEAEKANNGIEKSNNILVKSFNSLKNITEGVVNKVKTSITSMNNTCKETAEKMKQNNNNAAGSFEKIKKTANETKDTVKTAASGMASSLSQAATSASNTSNTIKSKMNEVASSVEKAGNSIKELAKKTKSAGEEIEKIGDTMTDKLTKPVGAAGVAAVGLAVDFEQSFAMVNTLMNLSGKELEDYEAKLQKTAVNMSVGLGEFSDATYQAISAGVDYKEAIDFVGEAVKLAKGGMMETAGAVDTLTTILNTYGDKAGDLTQIQDKLIATQNKGKTTVGELGMALADIIPNASALSVNFDDLLGSMAHMTAGGMKTASAGTKLRAMLDELGKSGTKASDILKEKTGKSFKELMESGKSLDEVLLIVNEGAKEAGVSLADMFGSTEAAGAANSIIGNLEGFKESVDAVKDSAKLAQQTYEIATDTMKEKIKGAVVAIQSSFVDLGQKMEPLLDAIIEFAKKIPELLDDIDFEAVVKPFLDVGIEFMEMLVKIMEWFSKLDKGTQNFILKAVLIGTVLGPVISLFGKVITGISGIINAFGVFTSFMGGGVIKTLGAVLSKVGGLFTFLFKSITGVMGGLMKIVGGLISGIVKIVGTAFGAMAKSVIPFVVAHAPLILAILAVIGVIYLLVKNWDKLKEAATNAIEGIKEKWGAFTEWIGGLIPAMLEGIKNAWEGFKSFMSESWNNLLNKGQEIFNAIKENLSNIWSNMTSFLTDKWNAFTEGWSNITSAISEKIKGQFETIKNNLSNIFSNMTQRCSEKFNELFGKIKDIAGKIREAISNLVSKLKNAFNFKWSLPKIKLPKISISGGFSLNPPSAPKFSIAWRHNGAIFTKPTVLANGQGVGDGFKGMGAQKEAVLPLEKLPDLLGLNERQGGDINLNIETFENNRDIDIEQLVKELSYFARKRGLNYGI